MPSDDEFTAKVRKIALAVLESELEGYQIGRRHWEDALDSTDRAKLLDQIAEHIAQLVARDTM